MQCMVERINMWLGSVFNFYDMSKSLIITFYFSQNRIQNLFLNSVVFLLNVIGLFYELITDIKHFKSGKKYVFRVLHFTGIMLTGLYILTKFRVAITKSKIWFDFVDAGKHQIIKKTSMLLRFLLALINVQYLAIVISEIYVNPSNTTHIFNWFYHHISTYVNFLMAHWILDFLLKIKCECESILHDIEEFICVISEDSSNGLMVINAGHQLKEKLIRKYLNQYTILTSFNEIFGSILSLTIMLFTVKMVGTVTLIFSILGIQNFFGDTSITLVILYMVSDLHIEIFWTLFSLRIVNILK